MAEKKPSKIQSPAPQTSGGKSVKNDKQPGKGLDKTKGKPAQQPKKLSGCLLYLILTVFAITVITGVTVAAADYLGFISLKNIKEEVGKKYQLQKYPILSKYFPEVDTNFDPVPLGDGSSIPKPVPEPPGASVLPDPKTNVFSMTDVLREEEKKKNEAARRVSRLARLYGEMKPVEAVAVMKELDDETVLAIFTKMEDDQVAKILALFETARAAKLTQDMLKGQPVKTIGL